MSSNFKKYKELPEPLINVVTSMTVCDLLRITKVSSVQRLPFEFFNRGDSSPPESKAKSKFWYKKLNGVPFRFKEDFAKVCSLFPETKRLLLHPVWPLLSNPQCTEYEVKELAASLPIYVQKQIISPKTLLITETKAPYKYLLLDVCDALFCLIAHYLKSPTEKSARLSYCMTTSLILSLFAHPYNKSRYGIRLYSALWPLYESFQHVFKRSIYLDTDGSKRVVADIQSSLSTNIITSEEEFVAFLKIYGEIISTAYEKLDIFKNIEEARKFMLMTPNSQLHELKWNLKCFPNHRAQGHQSQLDISKDFFYECYLPIKNHFN